MTTMKMHHSITSDRVADAVERHNVSFDYPGFCVACGVDVDGVEPDAREYDCECCDAKTVYGAEELLFCMGVT